jgi:succinate dehydrogenase / fumarate reductase membrane anchor subunit
MGTGTGLGRVRGLGSAKDGAKHWLAQRATAVGNLVLGLWLIASLFIVPVGNHATMVKWLAQPLVAVPMMLLLVSVCYHVALGMRVLIEDYIHDEALKFGALVVLTFYTIGSAAFGIFAIAKIAFGAVSAAAGMGNPNV